MAIQVGYGHELKIQSSRFIVKSTFKSCINSQRGGSFDNICQLSSMNTELFARVTAEVGKEKQMQ